MWELDHKEVWVPKNWCFWTVVLNKTLESPLNCKEIKWVNSKENQTWIFIGRTDAKGEALILWPPDWKSPLIEKTLMLGKIEGKRRRGGQRMRWLGQHHWFNGHEFEQTPGDTEEQGSLAYCSPWGRQELDMTERLNWTEHNAYSVFHSHVIFYYCLHYLHKSPTVSSFKFWPWLGIIHRHGLFGYKSHISNRLKELIHWGIVGLHHRSV